MSRIDDALRRARENAGETVDAVPEVETDIIDRFPRGLEKGAPYPQKANRTEPVATESWLGSAADFEPAPGMLALSPVVREKLVVGEDSVPVAVEQYRRLAATLHHAQAERNLRVIMTASALAGEGKTLTATNLALTLSESYKRRVLLIDADLRRPAIHQIFELSNASGLTDGLKSETPGQKMTVIQVTPRLSVITAGRPDPDPLGGLSSQRMQELVREAAASFDWVIIDTPPVLLMPDANLVAGIVDAVVLVIAAGRTPHDSIQRTIAALGRDRIIGVVLNRVAGQEMTGSQYESYYGGQDGVVKAKRKK